MAEVMSRSIMKIGNMGMQCIHLICFIRDDVIFCLGRLLIFLDIRLPPSLICLLFFRQILISCYWIFHFEMKCAWNKKLNRVPIFEIMCEWNKKVLYISSLLLIFFNFCPQSLTSRLLLYTVLAMVFMMLKAVWCPSSWCWRQREEHIYLRIIGAQCPWTWTICIWGHLWPWTWGPRTGKCFLCSQGIKTSLFNWMKGKHCLFNLLVNEIFTDGLRICEFTAKLNLCLRNKEATRASLNSEYMQYLLHETL